MAGDPARFTELVDALVPGRGVAGRAHSIVLLSKAARRAFFFHNQNLIPDAHPDQDPPQEPHNTDLPLCTGPNGYLQPGPVLYSRFTPKEARELWGCFQHIDAALQAPGPLGWEPGFQGGLSNYTFHEVPEPYGLVPRFGSPAL